MKDRKNDAYIIDAHIGSADGHGTKMAAIAGGRINGVAPRANLYLMKIKGHYNNGDKPRPDRNPIKSARIFPRALAAVFDEIRRDVLARRLLDPRAKSVINMSWGK